MNFKGELNDNNTSIKRIYSLSVIILTSKTTHKHYTKSSHLLNGIDPNYNIYDNHNHDYYLYSLWNKRFIARETGTDIAVS